MSYEVLTHVDSVKSKIDTAVSVINMAKLLIPSDKAPMLLKTADLVGALIQTREFQEVAAFGVDLVDLLVDHFAHRIKAQA